MARTSYIRRDDDDVRSVLDQDTYLAFYSASSLKQQFMHVDISLHLDTLS
jgi:hypothetical protein